MSSTGKGKSAISIEFTVKGCGKSETDLYVRQQVLDTNLYSGSEKKPENTVYTYTKTEFSWMCYYSLS